MLGWCPKDNRELFTLEELVEAFDYHDISKSPAVLDMNKLRWMNGEYLKAMSEDKFYEMAEPYLREAIKKDLDLRKIASMVKTRIEVFPQIGEMVDFFEQLPDYDRSLYLNKKWKVNEEKALQVLEDMEALYEAHDDFTNDALYEVIKKYSEEKGCKAGFVIWPLRIALSGKAVTPAGATEIMEVIGKEETLKRIRAGIELLK